MKSLVVHFLPFPRAVPGMTNWSPPTRKDIRSGHTAQAYRWYRCTGACGTEIVALGGSWLACGQPECRGRMKPSNRISSKRLATEQFEEARRVDSNSRLTPRFSGVFRSESPEVDGSDSARGEGVLGVPWLGVALVQEQVISALLNGGSVVWQWSPQVKEKM